MKRLHDKIDQQAAQIETQAQTIQRQNIKIGQLSRRNIALEAAHQRHTANPYAKIFKGQNNG